MKRLKNKWFVLAAFWLVAVIYGLVFQENTGNRVPPFPYFDKWVHGLLFFGQFWLWARGFILAKKAVPYKILLCVAFVIAIATEWSQEVFTETRQADVWDGAADMVGAIIALILAHYAAKIWTGQPTKIKAE